MKTGIAVSAVTRLNSAGNRITVVSHRRDSTTLYRMAVHTEDPGEALKAWMGVFTGEGSRGLSADFEIVARGGDAKGYWYVLSPTNFN